TLWAFPHNDNRTIYRAEAFIMAAILLFIAGCLAAAVAWQIRRHVLAALAEAQTRLKLDRIRHDLDTARSIQIRLLPTNPPAAPRVSASAPPARAAPARRPGPVTFTWKPPPEAPHPRLPTAIPLAAGHGLAPPLPVPACRASFRALASHDDPLESITSRVDQL